MRWVAGFLLVCAAILKAAELLNQPAATMVSPFGGRFLPIQIGVELAVGLLVLSGVYWPTLRWFVVLLFSSFAAYSQYQAMTGAASCGCFGPMRVHPWWTFALDLVVVLGLLIPGRLPNISTNRSDARPVPYAAGRRNLIAAILGVSIVAIALLARYVDLRTAVAEGMSATGGLVVLEPEQWVGKPLPIADFVDLDLSSGEWILLLHRHDCPDCQEALPRYEQLASLGERVALIEVPPYGDSEPLDSACQYGRLKDDRDWFVQTPAEIRLRDGIVMAVQVHGH